MEVKKLLKETRNGACDQLRLLHYPAYAPGYVVEVADSGLGRGTSRYWFHDLAQAEVLYNALLACAQSDFESNCILQISAIGGSRD